MLLELLIAGSLTTYQPKQETIVNIKPEPTPIIEIIKPLETPEIVKTHKTPLKPLKPRVAPLRGSYAPKGWYPVNQCTHYVNSRRPTGLWHDAITWPASARAAGWYVGPKPIKGAIGQRGNHVVYIHEVSGDKVYLSERNYDYHGSYRERWAPASDFTYIY